MHALSVAQPSGEVACPHVPADAVLLHQLAHETSTGPNPVLRQRQTPRYGQTRRPRRRRPTFRYGTGRSRAQNAPTTTPHSFTSLLANLATICANQIQPADNMPTFTIITRFTPPQRQVFELLAVTHRHGYA